MFNKLSVFQQRLYISIATITLCFLFIYLSYSSVFQWAFAAALTAIVCTALWEYFNIAKIKGFQPLVKISLISSIFYVFAVFVSSHFFVHMAISQMALFMLLLIFFGYYCFASDSNPIVNLAISLFGFVYITMTITCLISINYFFPEHSQDGRLWLLYILAVTKMADVGGYVIGKKIGGKSLAPIISPKKTVSGAFGGLAFAIASSLLITVLLHFFSPDSFRLSLVQSIWLGAIVGSVGQFGDLAESLLKRDGGVKDSNRLPGLGGVLDVMDSLIFTIPLVYFFMLIMY